MVQLIYNNRKAIIFLFIILVAFVQRGSTLFVEFYDVDEITDVLMTTEIMLGGKPYIDAVPGRPLYFIFFYISFFIFGIGNILGLHFMTILLVIATAYFLYKTNKLLFSERAGYFAALFYVIFVSGFLEHYLAAHGETVMNLPSAISFYFFVLAEKAKEKKISYFYYFLSGFLLFIAFLTKGHTGLIMIVYGIYLVIIRSIIVKGFYNNLLYLVFIVIGFIWSIVPIIYLYEGYLLDMLSEYLYGNSVYISSSFAGISLLPFLKKTVENIGQNTIFQLPLWLLLIYFLVKNKLALRRDLGFLLLLTYLAVTFLGIFLGADRLYNHYFIQYIPALCLISGYSLISLIDSPPNHRVKVLALNILLVMSIVVTVSWNYTNGFLSHFYPSKVFSWSNSLIPKDSYIKISDWIKENSNRDDKILVWGDAIEIYYFSNRRPGIRFLWSTHYVWRYQAGLRHSIKEADSRIESVFVDLDKKKPLYFIDTAPSNYKSFGKYPLKDIPILYNYVKKHYKYINNVNKMDIYKRKV